MPPPSSERKAIQNNIATEDKMNDEIEKPWLYINAYICFMLEEINLSDFNKKLQSGLRQFLILLIQLFYH